MSWETSEENQKQRANLGKYFKLADDGDQARIVLLTEPDEQEKEGNNGAYTVYTIDVWNVDGTKVQTWDMGSAQFKSLLGMKRMLGLPKLYGGELIVARNGKKGDTSVTYAWTIDGPITAATLEAMHLQGVTPARIAGGAVPAGRPAPAPVDRPFHAVPVAANLEGGMVLATNLTELRTAFENAWAEADGFEAVQVQLQARYEACKAELSKPAAAPAASQKRAPAF